jgi:hypothetical protein
MAATILNSPRAVEMSIYVVRAFVRLRELLASNKELAKRLDELEAHVVRQFGTYDQAIAGILNALRQLTNPSSAANRVYRRSGRQVIGSLVRYTPGA